MQVTFKKDGIDCISLYDNNQSRAEIERLMHEGDVRKQIAQAFRNEFKREKDLDKIGDGNLGYVLQKISKMHFSSRISNIEFFNDNRRFNINLSNQK